MDHTKRRIAVLYRIYNDPDSKQIIDLVNCLVLILHFFVDAEKVLDSSINLRLNSSILYMLTDFVNNALDIFLPDTLSDCDLVYQVIICLRLQIFQRKVIQLYLDLGNTESLCNGCVNFQRFSGNPLLALRLLILKCPHIVKTVCQLDQDHTDILGHGKKHLPEVLCLHLQTIRFVSVPHELQLLQLGHTIYKKRHLFSKLLPDLILCHNSVFYHIM